MARTDDVINVAGHRLSTGALEEVLLVLALYWAGLVMMTLQSVASFHEVVECAVVGLNDSIKGQVPLAFVILGKGNASVVAAVCVSYSPLFLRTSDLLQKPELREKSLTLRGYLIQTVLLCAMQELHSLRLNWGMLLFFTYGILLALWRLWKMWCLCLAFQRSVYAFVCLSYRLMLSLTTSRQGQQSCLVSPCRPLLMENSSLYGRWFCYHRLQVSRTDWWFLFALASPYAWRSHSARWYSECLSSSRPASFKSQMKWNEDWWLSPCLWYGGRRWALLSVMRSKRWWYSTINWICTFSIDVIQKYYSVLLRRLVSSLWVWQVLVREIWLSIDLEWRLLWVVPVHLCGVGVVFFDM